MAGKLIVVTGITGSQGGSVASHFLSLGWKVRGLSRDPTKASAQQLASKGIDMVKGSFDSVDSMKAAFRGANVVFGNTDFWTSMADPAVHTRAAQEKKEAGQICKEIEKQQRDNMNDAVAAVMAEEPGKLELYVLSTLPGVEVGSSGKLKHCFHFDGKFDSDMRLKKNLPELWAKTSTLLMGTYMVNWDKFGGMAPQKQSDGTYLLTMPMKPDNKMLWVDADVDTGPLVEGLVRAGPGNHLLGGDSKSFKEYAEFFAKATNTNTRFEEQDSDEAIAAVNAVMPGVGQEFVEMFQWVDEFGFAGNASEYKSPEELGVKVTKFNDYIAKTDFSKIL